MYCILQTSILFPLITKFKTKFMSRSYLNHINHINWYSFYVKIYFCSPRCLNKRFQINFCYLYEKIVIRFMDRIRFERLSFGDITVNINTKIIF